MVDDLQSPSSRQVELSVSVVYLRPTVRTRLLVVLAELGLFVTEFVVGDLASSQSVGSATDVIIVLCDTSQEHLDVVRRLQLTGRPIVAILPSGVELPPAVSAIDWAQEGWWTAVSMAVARAAGRARAVRTGGADRDPLRMGNVALQLKPPQLVGREASVTLSQAERDVLVRLLIAGGNPVGSQHMDPSITANYLKTIVMRLRRKLVSVGADTVTLGSVRGLGYVLRQEQG